jgi:hypothetical protein
VSQFVIPASRDPEIPETISLLWIELSSIFNKFWTPAFAGVTALKTFHEAAEVDFLKKGIIVKSIHLKGYTP